MSSPKVGARGRRPLAQPSGVQTVPILPSPKNSCPLELPPARHHVRLAGDRSVPCAVLILVGAGGRQLLVAQVGDRAHHANIARGQHRTLKPCRFRCSVNPHSGGFSDLVHRLEEGHAITRKGIGDRLGKLFGDRLMAASTSRVRFFLPPRGRPAPSRLPPLPLAILGTRRPLSTHCGRSPPPLTSQSATPTSGYAATIWLRWVG